MRIDHIDGKEYWTAESSDDLRDWLIINREPWTETVSRLHCCRPLDTSAMEFRMIYCRTSILREITTIHTTQ